ncbi:MAG TPA: malonyl-CoA decarboxylase [Usitatibacter sp.]|jgi:malonyl-CoA decarboxylase|nr:malonyl-CoA decarboxylase [Usitatibacter sp.]
MSSARSVIDRIVGTIAATGIVRTPSQRRADRLASVLRTLISERGEATGAALARRSLGLYRGLDPPGRLRFFEALAREFSPDRDAVLAAATAYHRDPSPEHLAALERVAEPPRQEVFRRMNMAPGGTGLLLELRSELLERMKADHRLSVVDNDLVHLLGSWFNRGFLELRRIDWKTPAAILEKLIAYEAVHEIHGFPDLKRRLERDRRCFAFFHPALPDEPLIFVEVAFVNEVPSEVAPILALESAVGDPRRARCAVFYSITSCQPGLKGISFGNFLIKQVAQDLHAELPNLKVFATLSPVPGLRAWARKALLPAGGAVPEDHPHAQLLRVVADASAFPPPALREPLEGLVAWYLTREWREGHAADSVARFHLGNGARLERVNWLADGSAKGLAQSFGLMVNYVYDLGDVERNHEEYVNRHHIVASSAVEWLARHVEPLLDRPSPSAAGG